MTERMEDHDDGLGEQLRAQHAAGFPRDEIERRIRATIMERAASPAPRAGRAGVRALLAAAAALALFIAGAEYGRRTADPLMLALPMRMDDFEIASVPLSIQSTGSRHMASLARFTEESELLTPEQRRTAREVALAMLAGAALELLRESGTSESLRAAADLIAVTQEAQYTPPPGTDF
jgi:hypothetical protein